ncbi:uncharacterized protein G6M90_00g001300 [Metarhizium brunneum]|uniref:Uncharacterized protein n=1 Tax=Metarhizium brunneum TaxID=500148 RepID=A0A7D5USU2_9HYPO
MKIAVLATVSGLFLAASTLALPATSSAQPEASSEQWQEAFMSIWSCHCTHRGGQDYKKHVKKDMQCMIENTATTVGNFETGEKDSLVEMDKEVEKCKAAAWQRARHSECEPGQYETECYFPIWKVYSTCVGNSPSTSKRGSDCPKNPNSKPEKVKGDKAKPQGANSEEADECPEDPSSKPEEAKSQEANPEEADECPEDPSSKPEEAKSLGDNSKEADECPEDPSSKPEEAKSQGAKTQGATSEEVEPEKAKTQESKPEKAAKTQEAKQA